MVTTPAMLLNLPDVGVTPGPLWASMLNQSFFDVDTHDHSSNKGVQVTPSGLNINVDLSFNSNNAISLRSTKYDNQGAFLPNTDLRAIYVKGGDLYYNNNLGQPIKITSGTTLNITGIGSIGGDYGQPGVQAAVTYSDITKIYLFVQSPGVTGGIACGPISIFENIMGANAVTIRTPVGLGSAYTIRLFPSLPATNNELVAINPSGNLTTGNACFSSGGITTNKLLNTNDTFNATNNMLTAPQGTNAAIAAVGTAGRVPIAWDTSNLALSYAYPGTNQVIQFYPVGCLAFCLYNGVPIGFLVCDGQAVSRTTYAALFALIGTAYGIGDGVTTFNLPDFRGRVPMGSGTGPANYLGDANPVLTTRSMFTAGGRETHTLSLTEMPAHTHDKGTYNIPFPGGGKHDHVINMQPTGVGTVTYLAATRGTTGTRLTEYGIDALNDNGGTTGSGEGIHDHPNSEFAGDSGSTGGSGAHNNVQPWLTVVVCIKF